MLAVWKKIPKRNLAPDWELTQASQTFSQCKFAMEQDNLQL